LHEAAQHDILLLMTAKAKRRTLCVGDTHGHLDRLEALLKQEGLLDDCPDSGVIRVNRDVEVVSLGDLGHYGRDTQARDHTIWEYAAPWLDVILWGNHDRAVIDGRHFFMGYQKPFPETVEAINAASKSKQLRLAHEAHGFLLTHAGLHASYAHNEAPHGDAASIACWLNALDGADSQDQDFLAIRDAISVSRGGRSTNGGILWRDASESLYKPVRQVFGHSSKEKVRTYQTGKTGDSFCVDTGNQVNGKLNAIWLPSEEIVEVKLEDKATKKLRAEAEKRVRDEYNDPFWAEDGPWRNFVT
jgi:hypothetical protein